jgi:hypothetical protein
MATATETRRASLVENESMTLYAAAGLAFTSQAIHLWLVPGKLVFAFLPGLFFLAVAIGQGLLGARLLFGPGAWAIRLGIPLNLSVASLWALTRVVSLPNVTGLTSPGIEPLGLAVTIAEVALVILLIVYVRQ